MLFFLDRGMKIWLLLPFPKHFYGKCIIRSSSGHALRIFNLQMGDMGQELDFLRAVAVPLPSPKTSLVASRSLWDAGLTT